MTKTQLTPVGIFAWTHAVIRGTRDNKKLKVAPLLLIAYRRVYTCFQSQEGIDEGDSTTSGGPAHWSTHIDAAIQRIGPHNVIEAFRTALACDELVDKYLEFCLAALLSCVQTTSLRTAYLDSPMASVLSAVLDRQVSSGRGPAYNFLEYMPISMNISELVTYVR